jgi:hypothetical protein
MCGKFSDLLLQAQNILYINISWSVSIERPRFPSGYDWVGWDTAPQAGKSRVQIPMWQMEFCVTNSFRLHHSLGVVSASDKNEFQQYVLFGKVGRCLKLSSLLPSYAGSLKILRASNSCSPHALCKPAWVCFVSVVNAILHDSESLITGVGGF